VTQCAHHGPRDKTNQFQLLCILSYQALLTESQPTIQHVACNMPHGPMASIALGPIISLDQGFKGIGGLNATWEGLHPPQPL
jgi:hypothetical protein